MPLQQYSRRGRGREKADSAVLISQGAAGGPRYCVRTGIGIIYLRVNLITRPLVEASRKYNDTLSIIMKLSTFITALNAAKKAKGKRKRAENECRLEISLIKSITKKEGNGRETARNSSKHDYMRFIVR